MGKQPFVSHVVNGYSRYDVPESKAFTCTPGILYPVRIDFVNARDRITLDQGIDVRSNPLAVPSFNPYTVRLHRFWVPLQLYHPEMRTNSSKFDMNNLSLNWIPATITQPGSSNLGVFVNNAPFSNSLLSWLRISNKSRVNNNTSTPTPPSLNSISLPSNAADYVWANADTYLAYWDIVRNYYGYSQWGVYSFASPASFVLNISSNTIKYNSSASYFTQCFGNIEYLDAFYESQFYPSALTSTNNTFNRSNLFAQILTSNLATGSAASSDGYPVSTRYADMSTFGQSTPASQFSISSGSASASPFVSYFLYAHPMAVVPSNPDRFSRLLPVGSGSAVSMSGVSTIPQLAIASRLQEYKDLLGAGGSRYSDWLETFFASKIEHVDRPKLLFSASQTVNVQVVMNQAGSNNFITSGFGSNDITSPLGQQGGSIAFNSRLGRRQSYYFREPGYLIDMLSIRPVYYWAGIRPDYLNYKGADYFNPIYNDIGYQDVPTWRLLNGSNFLDSVSPVVAAYEPCFNEFRSSYDEVLGQISASNGPVSDLRLYSYWVQQRYIAYDQIALTSASTSAYPLLFVDVSRVNSPFASDAEDNFFVNMSYSVQKKNLVNKTFATRLSNR
jgi:hypothetical protein